MMNTAYGNDDWYQGIFNGEIKNSDPEHTDYTTRANVLFYGEIDTEKTAEVMEVLFLDIFMADVKVEADGVDTSEQEWSDLYRFVYARDEAIASSAPYYTETVALWLGEPEEHYYTAYYTFSPEMIAGYRLMLTPLTTPTPPPPAAANGYQVLNDIEDAFTDNSVSPAVIHLPDVLVLDEIDNWMELPHEPHAENPLLIPIDEVRDFVDAAHTMTSSDDGMDVWSYMGDKSAMMIGMPSWVMGPNPNGNVPFGDGHTIGMSFDVFCRDVVTMPGGLIAERRGLFFSELSFLHYDTESSKATGSNIPDPSAPPDTDSSELHVYLENGDGIWHEIGLVDNNYNYINDDGEHCYETTDGGFPFYSPVREEGIELINTGNLANIMTCGSVGDGVKNTIHVQMECHTPTAGGECEEDYAYISDIQFRNSYIGNCGLNLEDWTAPELVLDGAPYLLAQDMPTSHYENEKLYINPGWFYQPYYSEPYTYPYDSQHVMAFPLPNSWLEVQETQQLINLNPTMQSHPVCFPFTIQNIDVDSSQITDEYYPANSGQLSISNKDYRLFSTPDPDDSLDGIVVRYTHNYIESDVSDTTFDTNNDDYYSYTYFDPIALKRIQTAVTDAVDPDDLGEKVSLSYVETNSWILELDQDWVVSVLDASRRHTNGIIGGAFSLGWWNEDDNDRECCGEFTERTALHNVYDFNQSTETTDQISTDNWDLYLFYSADRKIDAVPGWFQSWTKTIDAPTEGLSFEWAVDACSGCSSDTVIEVSGVDSNNAKITQAWVLDENSAEPEFLTGFPTPVPNLTFTEGLWDITVVMYTIDHPHDRRDAWFRLVNVDDSTFDGFVPWNYYSGVLGEGVNAPEVTMPHNDFSSSLFMWTENCMGAIFQSSLNWEDECKASR